jgi:hypothetical protein
MMVLASRLARRLAAVLLLPLAANPLAAQSASAIPAVHSPGFGGGGVFVSPHAAASLGRFRVGGELEVAWGKSSAREGTAFLSTALPGDFRLTGGWTGNTARAAWERRSDQSLGLTLERDRAALTVARHWSQAAFEEYTSEVDGVDARLAVALGTPLHLIVGLTGRTSSVVQRGDLRGEQRIIVAGYEFISVRRLEFIEASRHRDLELELSGAAGGLRLSGFLGRGFSDGAAPDRTWAYGRVTRHLVPQLEFVAEAGRNGGVPAIGRMPQSFARLGVRVNLAGKDATPRAAPLNNNASAIVAGIDVSDDNVRLIITAHANTLEIKGNFTAWHAVPMRRGTDGRWSIDVKEGVLQFNIRIDGRDWTVPAGVPVVQDEFSGAPVAVLVVTR